MRLGIDPKDLLAQAGCPEVAIDPGKAQFSVIGYLFDSKRCEDESHLINE